jgi:hypothetical protein
MLVRDPLNHQGLLPRIKWFVYDWTVCKKATSLFDKYVRRILIRKGM